MFMINPKNKTPIYEQLIQQLRHQIATGALAGGEPISSVRQLSIDLGVNPNTIQKAYRQMEQEGLIYTVSGKGSFITDEITPLIEKQRADQLAVLTKELEKARDIGIPLEDVQKRLMLIY
ncbi:MAG: GntR family transcriptional regulator [Eubacteriales bacterium]|nr:GntR family transcriptional regulator [Eubacteriales bacterium]